MGNVSGKIVTVSETYASSLAKGFVSKSITVGDKTELHVLCISVVGKVTCCKLDGPQLKPLWSAKSPIHVQTGPEVHST
jgi:hypothetical protein